MENLEKIITPNKKFWKNKRVLITGHTGFKGSWLTCWLLSYGAIVYGYSLKQFDQRGIFNKLKLKKKIKKNFFKDINNFYELKKTITSIKPNVIFHMAAQSLVIDSYKNSLNTVNTNTFGTAKILEASKYAKSLRSIIILTTDKVYENFEKKNYSYKENDKLGGVDIYSASKSSAELIVSAYRQSFQKAYKNCGIASVRAGNVIGGGDWAKNRLIPDIINGFKKKRPKIILRNPNFTRPWQHVLEPLLGYILLAEKTYGNKKSIYNSSWNFGPKNSLNVTVIKILDIIKKIYQKNIKIILSKKKPYKESKFLKLDSSRSEKILGWKSKLSTEQALINTIRWYKFYESSNDYNYTLKQIDDYCNK